MKLTSSRLLNSVLLFVAGALFVHSFAPFPGYALAFFLLPALLFLTRDQAPGQVFRTTWMFMTGMFVGGLYWIYYSMFTHSGLKEFGIWGLLVILVVLLALSAYLALYAALSMSLTRKWFDSSKASTLYLVLPAMWVLFEWLRSWILTGFPYLSLGYSQTGSVVSQFASITGVSGISFLVLAGGALIYHLFQDRVRQFGLLLLAVLLCSMFAWQYALWVVLLTALFWLLWQRELRILVLPAVIGLAWIASLPEWTRPVSGEPLKVALLQGNILQSVKWVKPELSLGRYARMTLDVYKQVKTPDAKPDLIVLPETAIPRYYHEVKKEVIEPLRDISKRQNVEVILGIPVAAKGKDDSAWNTVVKLGKTTQYYYKIHLVPFGEYMPLQAMLTWFYEAMNIPMNNFVPGKVNQSLITVRNHPVGAFVCYEIAFPAEVRRVVPKARLLINLSNNAWFFNPKSLAAIKPALRKQTTGLAWWYRDSSEAWQQLQMAQMRAIETGRYVLSVTNDGVTAIINHRGQVVKALPRYQAGILSGKVRMREGATPFVLFGNYPVLLFAAAVLILVSIRNRLRGKNS